MQIYCLYIRFLILLCLSVVTAYAMPLSSAKVIISKGIASYEGPETEITPISEGTILSEGDSITTSDSGVVYLIFSNGVGLTIEENSKLVLSKLAQRPFWRSELDELPEEEISRSNFILELKYGRIKGEVKGLRKDSKFRIKTLMGDFLPSKNLFFAKLFYDPFRRKIILTVQNVNGLIDLITKFSGSVKFGRKNNMEKSYDPESLTYQIVRIPQKRSISIKGSRSCFAPNFKSLIQQFPKGVKPRLVTEFETIVPSVDDPEEVVTDNIDSPENVAESDTTVEDITVEEEPKDIMVDEIVPEKSIESTMPESIEEEIVPASVFEGVVPETSIKEVAPENLVEEETTTGILVDEIVPEAVMEDSVPKTAVEEVNPKTGEEAVESDIQ